MWLGTRLRKIHSVRHTVRRLPASRPSQTARRMGHSRLGDFGGIKIATGLAGLAFFRQAGLRGVVALAVDRRHLGSHGTEVRGKLPAMMDRVVQRKLYEADGRKLEHAPEVQHLRQSLTVDPFELL